MLITEDEIDEMHADTRVQLTEIRAKDSKQYGREVAELVCSMADTLFNTLPDGVAIFIHVHDESSAEKKEDQLLVTLASGATKEKFQEKFWSGKDTGIVTTSRGAVKSVEEIQ